MDRGQDGANVSCSFPVYSPQELVLAQKKPYHAWNFIIHMVLEIKKKNYWGATLIVNVQQFMVH